jgi:hypothetical protein
MLNTPIKLSRGCEISDVGPYAIFTEWFIENLQSRRQIEILL